ncbi:TIGR03085 family metal-binding protein [Nocardioides pantholopis]|uniref:TIGR03085 family metal-binding protein n=1 Tax=Nocardioides pantholopis TaxID=2483798 RepID=UPI000F0792F5|nr:TIGR03085 family metal-binding protein [Nocardioides pantholopis]
MSGEPLSRRERRALCDLALLLGEDAPTLCEGWEAKDLVIHLLVRERHPLAAVGTAVPRLGRLAEGTTARLEATDLSVLVERLRSPSRTPFAVPAVDQAANSIEMFVHHEDLRRAQPDWSPRALDRADADLLWRGLGGIGRLRVRSAGVPVRVVRSDTGESTTLRGGPYPVTLTGPVSELLLLVFGRAAVRDVEYAGPPERQAALRSALLGS